MSKPASKPSNATVAAEIGLAVMACWEAITAIPRGRSGRILVSVATSAIRIVTCAGFFLNKRSATLTIRSNPPAACIHAAAEITATIISITSIGGAVGCSPNTNVRIPNPIPPMTPSPIPPRRAPMMIAVKTKASCKIISSIYLKFYFSIIIKSYTIYPTVITK